jgi:starch phosphorylase
MELRSRTGRDLFVENLRNRLSFLSRNLCWSWNRDLDRVFRSIDVDLWRRVNHNPIAFLQDVDPELLSAKENDAYLLAEVIRIERWLQDYLATSNHWASYNAPGLSAFPVAYFSPEFALHESLPIYSGGLGALAGDHLKSCSDLGIPVWGVTLLYRQGYFMQQIDSAGRQVEIYKDLDTSRIAIERARHKDGTTVSVSVPLGDTTCTADVWQAEVGRCRLLLLDVRETGGGYSPRLYGGDRTTRIVQEIVLGIGGYRALCELKAIPTVLHLNEGHSAFAVLERIAHRMETSGFGFDKISDEVSESVVFTTHTPVEAGHDRFEPQTVVRLLAPLRERLGLTEKQFLSLGRVDPDNDREEFCMTVLALKLSQHANAVSSLHGLVSRQMWQCLWPNRRAADVPIGHITNGAHMDTWLAGELAQVYSDCLGSDWRRHLTDPEHWYRIEDLDEFSLWSIKVALKRRLFHFLLRRLEARRQRLGLSGPLPELRTDVLTI